MKLTIKKHPVDSYMLELYSGDETTVWGVVHLDFIVDDEAIK